jgi:hypothetical protein
MRFNLKRTDGEVNSPANVLTARFTLRMNGKKADIRSVKTCLTQRFGVI